MFPQIFHIGTFFLPTYGTLVAAAFLVSLWLVNRLSRSAALDADAVMNLGIYTAIAGMVGAKLMMILLDAGYYIENPGELFTWTTLQAGGIFYGGFLAALATAFVYLRRHKLPGLATADVFAPAVALGHAIGRLGCFTAGCCWGAECHLPWAVTFSNPEAERLTGVPLGIPLHPTQLYEALGEAVIFTVLYRRFAKPHRPGAIIGLYLLLYSTVRFLVEFVRAHDKANFHVGPFVLEQWIALGLFALGWFLLARRAPAVPVKTAKAR
jgi:phosphatidylglycerol:prolipoprotein diacylglycerol transferase